MSLYERFDRGVDRLVSAVEFTTEVLTDPELWDWVGRGLRSLWEFVWKMGVVIAIVWGLFNHPEAAVIILLGLIIFL